MLRRRGINGDLYVHQGILESALNSIFSSPNVITEARKEVSIKHPLTGQYLEVDVWYPDLSLCFEYQDDHHYQPTWYHQKPLAVVQDRDNIKKDLLLQRGETLVIVPCWWDGTSASLEATITFHRPDLSQSIRSNVNDLISANPPFNFFTEDTQLMLASFPHSVDMVDVNENYQWWLGEKYDGVRCFWSPNDNQMYSRYGFMIDIHPSVNKFFGDIVLDGEIWSGRGLYLETNGLIQANLHITNWALFKVICFDEASHVMTDQPFEHRYSLILSQFRGDNPTVIIAPRLLCDDIETLTSTLQQIVEEGGEGVILRKTQSLYQSGRSDDLIKLKGSRGDQEALVIEVAADGALLLQLPDSRNFMVSKEECTLHRQAICGDIVSFSHDFKRRSTSQDQPTHHPLQPPPLSPSSPPIPSSPVTLTPALPVPSNPIVYRIREDLSWEDVLQSSGVPVRLFLNEYPQKIENYPVETRSKQRDTLDKDARIAKSFWQDVNNRRELFERFASSKGADAMDSAFWYALKLSEVLKFKDMRSALFFKKRYGEKKRYKYYMASVIHLFPEVYWVKSKFKFLPKGKKEELKKNESKDALRDVWTDARDRRTFFDRIAITEGFDPLIPSNWYNITYSTLKRYKGYKMIVHHYHGGKLAECLMQLYPDIDLKKSKFMKYEQQRRRELLEKFARTKGGNPHDPHFWYTLNPAEFRTVKGFATFFQTRYKEEIKQLFPELRLQENRFTQHGKQKQSNRNMFDSFASAQGFDPLVAAYWYHVSRGALKQHKGISAAIKDKKVSDLLMWIYPDIGLQKFKFNN